MRAERPESPPATVHLLDAVAAPVRYRVSLLHDLSAVTAADWNRLLDLDDAPLASWDYLQGLEEAGCVGGETSWQPIHLTIRKLPIRSDDDFDGDSAAEADSAGELVAGAAAYLKYDSDGEWVDDFEWAAFAAHKGIAYYPKLVLAVPFNPVGGGRLLIRPDLPEEDRAALRELLLQAMKHVCQVVGLSSANVLFPRPEPAVLAAIEQAGFLIRQQEQYHFHNRGEVGPYESFEHFLQSLRSHRRNSIHRERRALFDAGFTVRTYRGLRDPGEDSAPEDSAIDSPRFSRQLLDTMFDLYVGTSQRYTGTVPYLNRRFFHLCAERIGDRLELVIARDREGAVVAGAWNLRGDRRLFGRYWGQRDGARIPFLHFETCYYHSVERCIKDGLTAFEPGHGGEHKLVRGFSPVLTYSAHFLRETRLRRPIASVLRHEKRAVLASLEAARRRSSLKPNTLNDASNDASNGTFSDTINDANQTGRDDPSSRSD